MGYSETPKAAVPIGDAQNPSDAVGGTAYCEAYSRTTISSRQPLRPPRPRAAAIPRQVAGAPSHGVRCAGCDETPRGSRALALRGSRRHAG